jgi:hypothetical protein
MINAKFAGRRPDGRDLFLLSPQVLHIFDFSMSMLPFAIKTDLVNALKSADVALKAHTDFMQLLLEELETDKARTQLKELWVKWIEKNYAEQPSEGIQNQAHRRSIGKVATPPPSPGRS